MQSRPWMIIVGTIIVAVSVGANSSSSGPTVKQREGTRIQNLAGELRETGRRWVISTTEGTTYHVLENLTLQRAVQALRDDPADRNWTVSGELTEFMGENYLFIQRLSRTPRNISGQRDRSKP
jgi:hypothetical protein